MHYSACVNDPLEEGQLQIAEYGDRLEFRFASNDGRGMLLGAVVAGLVGGCFIYFAEPLYLKLLCALIVISWVTRVVAGIAQGNSTWLMVRADGVVARGALRKLFSTANSVAVEDIEVIAYWSDPDGDASDLVVKRRFGRETLLPGVSRTQALLVLKSIHAKFPNLPVNLDVHQFSLDDLGWTGSKPITLGLSSPAKPDESRATKESHDSR